MSEDQKTMIDFREFWSNPSIKYGLIGGGITVLTLMFFYLAGLKTFANPTYGLMVFGFLFIITIALGVMAGEEEKQYHDGYLPFKDAMIQVFVTFFIVVICYHLYYYLLFNLIDPALHQELKSITLDQMQQDLKNSNMSEEKVEKKIQKFKEQQVNLSLGFTLMMIFISSVLSFLVALIVSAIIRKEPESN